MVKSKQARMGKSPSTVHHVSPWFISMGGLLGAFWGVEKENGPRRPVFPSYLAEKEGFEPSIRYNRIPDFESGAFDHSATSPES